MSLFGGIHSRFGAPIEEAGVAAIRRALGRSGDTVSVHRDERNFLAKVNLGIFDDLGIRVAAQGATAVAGHPLLHPGSTGRAKDVAALDEGLSGGDLRVLANCRGQFCLARSDPEGLVLATDFLGIRPLYYCVTEDYVFFATTLQTIEAVPGIDRRMDTLAVTEQLSFGYPLADRTRYAHVKCLRSGEALRVVRGEPRLTTYSAMDDVCPASESHAAQIDRAHTSFLDAVRLRSSDEDDTLAFLSGGLDSRCVAGALVAIGRQVTCLNIRRPRQLDTLLAERFAKQLGIPLILQDVPEGEPQYVSKGMACRRLSGRWSGRSSVMTGDGGSVGTGHVYLDPTHVRHMRAGDVDAASAYSLEQKGYPSRLAFPKASLERIVETLSAAIREELEALEGPAEPGRKYHIFLMRNDQRRHLHHHFEHLDIYRVEFMTPFYDSEYLRCVLAMPLDECLQHRAYYRWLERFPEPVRNMPWQAYPGHLPCPVPLADTAEGVRSQWQPAHSERWRRARPAFRDCLRHSWFGRLPAEVGIPRSRVLAALLLHALHVRNGIGMFRAFNAYRDSYERGGGAATPLQAGLDRPG